MAEKLVTVNLRRSVGVRNPGEGSPTLYGPGICQVPPEVARSIGAKILKDSPKESKKAETPLYEGFLRADFEAEAERRGINVTRTDGGSGDPRVEDYRAALEADDADKA